MVGYELSQQIHVAVVQSVDREIDFWFRALGAESTVGSAAALGVFFFGVLAGHNEMFTLFRDATYVA